MLAALTMLVATTSAPACEPPDLPFLEFTTQGASEEETLPLVVVLHSLGSSPEVIASYLADIPVPVRVVAPRGCHAYRHGHSWFAVNGKRRALNKLGGRISEAADAVIHFVAAYVADHPTEGRPVIVGFSQGAMVAIAVGVREPESVEGVVAVAGYLPPSMWPRSQSVGLRYPTFHFLHGDRDLIVPLRPTRRAARWLSTRGIPTRLSIYPGIGHAITPRLHADLIRAVTAALEGGRVDCRPTQSRPTCGS